MSDRLKRWLRMILLALPLALPFAGGALSGQDEPTVTFHRIEAGEVSSFATHFLYQRHPHSVNWSFAKRYRGDENWSEIVRDRTYAATIDIGADQVPELFIQVVTSNWCDADGCLTDIFRKGPKGYELICETALPAPDEPPATILPEVENGYHRLATADKTIVWNEKQEFDSGQLCSSESRGN